MIARHEKTPIMHRAVENNGVLYLAGVTGDDLSLSMGGQAKQAFLKVEELLKAHRSSKSALLSVQVFVTDMTAKEEMNAAWLEWLDADQLPARATIGVADLGPYTLIEVVATAAVLGRQWPAN